jgi:hypothetical protein
MAFDRRQDDRRSEERRSGDRRRGDRRSGGLILDPAERAEMRGPATQEEIDQVRGSLEYETWMLAATAKWLEKHRDKLGKPPANAHLESYLLHARNLIEFFFPTGPATVEQVIASDLVPDWAGHVSITPDLEELRDVARRHLARLSYTAADHPRPALIQEASRTLEGLREAFEDLLRGVGL